MTSTSTHQENHVRILVGNARWKLKELDTKIYQTCITSPPYYGLRDYDHPDQIGQEKDVEEYLSSLVNIFDEIWRVLKDNGTCWVNLSDCFDDKDMLCIPFRFALKMKERGWILRQEIIWSKPNVPPESTRDRCVRSHEYIFMFAKQKNYQFYKKRLRERGKSKSFGTPPKTKGSGKPSKVRSGGIGESRLKMREEYAQHGFIMRDKRSVWEVGVNRARNGHSAVFPVELIEPIVLVSTNISDKIIDPFGGSGTTGVAALNQDRSCDLVELNEEYAEIARMRIAESSKKSDTFSLLKEGVKSVDKVSDNPPHSIGSRLKLRRKELRLSKTVLAKQSGLSRKAIYNLENEKGNIEALSSVLNIMGMSLPNLPRECTIGDQVKARRKQLKLTQASLAKRVNLSTPTIRLLEKSKGRVSSLSKALTLLAPQIFWD